MYFLSQLGMAGASWHADLIPWYLSHFKLEFDDSPLQSDSSDATPRDPLPMSLLCPYLSLIFAIFSIAKVF